MLNKWTFVLNKYDFDKLNKNINYINKQTKKLMNVKNHIPVWDVSKAHKNALLKRTIDEKYTLILNIM